MLKVLRAMAAPRSVNMYACMYACVYVYVEGTPYKYKYTYYDKYICMYTRTCTYVRKHTYI